MSEIGNGRAARADVGIVRGGSAGAVLVGRLSEDPARAVLLLEGVAINPTKIMIAERIAKAVYAAGPGSAVARSDGMSQAQVSDGPSRRCRAECAGCRRRPDHPDPATTAHLTAREIRQADSKKLSQYRPREGLRAPRRAL
jgi:hypothetical protein